jgi:hypothetical protein
MKNFKHFQNTSFKWFFYSFLALVQAEDMQEIFEIVNREADLSMNRIVVMIKDMGMQDQVGNKCSFFI